MFDRLATRWNPRLKRKRALQTQREQVRNAQAGE